MKFIILACVFALVASSPVPQKDTVVITDDRDVRADGFDTYFETNDGYKRKESGRSVGESGALAQTGEIEFKLDNGETFVLRYVADENGYRPESSFLPVGPTVGK